MSEKVYAVILRMVSWCLSEIGSEEKLLNLEVLDWMKGTNEGKDSSGETGQAAVARSR